MAKHFIVTKVPERKKPILCVETGNKSYKLASFNDEYAAEEFCQVYNQIIDEVYEKGMHDAIQSNPVLPEHGATSKSDGA